MNPISPGSSFSSWEDVYLAVFQYNQRCGFSFVARQHAQGRQVFVCTERSTNETHGNGIQRCYARMFFEWNNEKDKIILKSLDQKHDHARNNTTDQQIIATDEGNQSICDEVGISQIEGQAGPNITGAQQNRIENIEAQYNTDENTDGQRKQNENTEAPKKQEENTEAHEMGDQNTETKHNKNENTGAQQSEKENAEAQQNINENAKEKQSGDENTEAKQSRNGNTETQQSRNEKTEAQQSRNEKTEAQQSRHENTEAQQSRSNSYDTSHSHLFKTSCITEQDRGYHSPNQSSFLQNGSGIGFMSSTPDSKSFPSTTNGISPIHQYDHGTGMSHESIASNNPPNQQQDVTYKAHRHNKSSNTEMRGDLFVMNEVLDTVGKMLQEMKSVGQDQKSLIQIMQENMESVNSKVIIMLNDSMQAVQTFIQHIESIQKQRMNETEFAGKTSSTQEIIESTSPSLLQVNEALDEHPKTEKQKTEMNLMNPISPGSSFSSWEDVYLAVFQYNQRCGFSFVARQHAQGRQVFVCTERIANETHGNGIQRCYARMFFEWNNEKDKIILKSLDQKHDHAPNNTSRSSQSVRVHHQQQLRQDVDEQDASDGHQSDDASTTESDESSSECSLDEETSVISLSTIPVDQQIIATDEGNQSICDEVGISQIEGQAGTSPNITGAQQNRIENIEAQYNTDENTDGQRKQNENTEAQKKQEENTEAHQMGDQNTETKHNKNENTGAQQSEKENAEAQQNINENAKEKQSGDENTEAKQSRNGNTETQQSRNEKTEAQQSRNEKTEAQQSRHENTEAQQSRSNSYDTSHSHLFKTSCITEQDRGYHSPNQSSFLQNGSGIGFMSSTPDSKSFPSTTNGISPIHQYDHGTGMSHESIASNNPPNQQQDVTYKAHRHNKSSNTEMRGDLFVMNEVLDTVGKMLQEMKSVGQDQKSLIQIMQENMESVNSKVIIMLNDSMQAVQTFIQHIESIQKQRMNETEFAGKTSSTQEIIESTSPSLLQVNEALDEHPKTEKQKTEMNGGPCAENQNENNDLTPDNIVLKFSSVDTLKEGIDLKDNSVKTTTQFVAQSQPMSECPRGKDEQNCFTKPSHHVTCSLDPEAMGDNSMGRIAFPQHNGQTHNFRNQHSDNDATEMGDVDKDVWTHPEDSKVLHNSDPHLKQDTHFGNDFETAKKEFCDSSFQAIGTINTINSVTSPDARHNVENNIKATLANPTQENRVCRVPNNDTLEVNTETPTTPHPRADPKLDNQITQPSRNSFSLPGHEIHKPAHSQPVRACLTDISNNSFEDIQHVVGERCLLTENTQDSPDVKLSGTATNNAVYTNNAVNITSQTSDCLPRDQIVDVDKISISYLQLQNIEALTLYLNYLKTRLPSEVTVNKLREVSNTLKIMIQDCSNGYKTNEHVVIRETGSYPTTDDSHAEPNCVENKNQEADRISISEENLPDQSTLGGIEKDSIMFPSSTDTKVEEDCIPTGSRTQEAFYQDSLSSQTVTSVSVNENSGTFNPQSGQILTGYYDNQTWEVTNEDIVEDWQDASGDGQNEEHTNIDKSTHEYPRWQYDQIYTGNENLAAEYTQNVGHSTTHLPPFNSQFPMNHRNMSIETTHQLSMELFHITQKIADTLNGLFHVNTQAQYNQPNQNHQQYHKPENPEYNDYSSGSDSDEDVESIEFHLPSSNIMDTSHAMNRVTTHRDVAVALSCSQQNVHSCDEHAMSVADEHALESSEVFKSHEETAIGQDRETGSRIIQKTTTTQLNASYQREEETPKIDTSPEGAEFSGQVAGLGDDVHGDRVPASSLTPQCPKKHNHTEMEVPEGDVKLVHHAESISTREEQLQSCDLPHFQQNVSGELKMKEAIDETIDGVDKGDDCRNRKRLPNTTSAVITESNRVLNNLGNAPTAVLPSPSVHVPAPSKLATSGLVRPTATQAPAMPALPVTAAVTLASSPPVSSVSGPPAPEPHSTPAPSTPPPPAPSVPASRAVVSSTAAPQAGPAPSMQPPAASSVSESPVVLASALGVSASSASAQPTSQDNEGEPENSSSVDAATYLRELDPGLKAVARKNLEKRLHGNSRGNKFEVLCIHIKLTKGYPSRVDNYDLLFNFSDFMDPDSGIFTAPTRGKYRFEVAFDQLRHGKGRVYLVRDDGNHHVIGRLLEHKDQHNTIVEWTCDQGANVWVEAVRMTGAVKLKWLRFKGEFMG